MPPNRIPSVANNQQGLPSPSISTPLLYQRQQSSRLSWTVRQICARSGTVTILCLGDANQRIGTQSLLFPSLQKGRSLFIFISFPKHNSPFYFLTEGALSLIYSLSQQGGGHNVIVFQHLYEGAQFACFFLISSAIIPPPLLFFIPSSSSSLFSSLPFWRLFLTGAPTIQK